LDAVKKNFNEIDEVNTSLHQSIAIRDNDIIKLKTKFEQEKQSKRDHLVPLIEDMKQAIREEQESIAKAERDIIK